MSLSTSMSTNPFMTYALSRQKTVDSASHSYTQPQNTVYTRAAWISQTAAGKTCDTFDRYSNAVDFETVLWKTSGSVDAVGGGKTASIISAVGGKETVSDASVASGKAAVSDTSAADDAKTAEYTKYLQSKYGNLTIKSVSKDQKTLEQLGKTMSGSDVIIAPNIVEEMANDPEKAAYYEGKIDAFFEDIPRQTALFAAKGLDYQPCGVVVHEDGSVTYISGCADSPERVAQVNAINKAKHEKQAAEREAALKRSQEAAAEQRNLMERYLSEKAFSRSYADLY